MELGTFWVTIAFVVDLAFRVIALVVVPRNRRPQTAMAWLLAIFFIPYFGFLAFVAFGSRRLPKKRRDNQLAINTHLRSRSSLLSPGIVVTPANLLERPEFPRWLSPTVRMNEKLGAMPMVAGNDVSFMTDYRGSIAEMASAIDAAETTVHVEFYIMSYDDVTREFFAALERAGQRGVTVRVLYDQVASARITGYRELRAELDRLTLSHQAMLPVQPWRGVYQRPDLRNHRKLLVIDSTLAYTGSQNIIEPSYRNPRHKARGLEWLDVMMKVEGPLADSLEALFVSDWYQETGELLTTPSPRAPSGPSQDVCAQVVPSGPAFEGENNLRLFNSLVYGARTRLVLSSPYFVPDESMRYAITTAAERGVEVHLMVSEIADQQLVFYAQRSYYDELLEAGVRIWLYRAPTILHSKFVIIDDAISVIGSSNIDMRSFSLNLEVSVLMASPRVVGELESLYLDYRSHSSELTLAAWRQRPWHARFIEGLARLTATVQ
ncbi:MAG: cardiolipin synthase [Microbacteriaceae bacterium]|nr:cardiolipin synthase [Microbacteriaceae bacterium]